MSKIHMLVDTAQGSQEEDRHADDYTLCGYTEIENLNITTWADIVDCKKCQKRLQPRGTPNGH